MDRTQSLLFSDCQFERGPRCDCGGAAWGPADSDRRLRRSAVSEDGGAVRPGHERVDSGGPAKLQSGRRLCGVGAEQQSQQHHSKIAACAWACFINSV